ncbi:hypothetical protein Tco_0844609 [Tanacetum coccineum]
MAGSRGFPRLVAHIKRLHLSSDDRRGALREALSTDCELFVSVGEALKALDQWVCGVCMCLHALSRACHHTDGMTRFKWVAGDVEEFIVGIVRPQVRREVVPLGGVVVDEVLLDRVFSLPITTVKSIPHSCRMAFSHALAAALGKVAATPTSIEAWVKLLLLPRCTLRVFRPSNRQERRSGNRKSLQCHSIQRALASWGGDGFIELIPSLFAQPLRVVSGKDDRVSGWHPSGDPTSSFALFLHPTLFIRSEDCCPNLLSMLGYIDDEFFGHQAMGEGAGGLISSRDNLGRPPSGVKLLGGPYPGSGLLSEFWSCGKALVLTTILNGMWYCIGLFLTYDMGIDRVRKSPRVSPNKDTAPPKPKMFRRVALFSQIVKSLE